MKTPIADLTDFAALDPFFRIIEKGLDGLAGPAISSTSSPRTSSSSTWCELPDTRRASKAAPRSPSSTAPMAP